MTEPVSDKDVTAIINKLIANDILGMTDPPLYQQALLALQSLLAERIATDAAWDMLFPKGQVGIGPRSVVDGAVTERALARHVARIEARKRAMAVAELRQQVE